MKTYKIKNTGRGYELVDSENTIKAIFHYVYGFHCLQDVVDYILGNRSVFKISANQLDI